MGISHAYAPLHTHPVDRGSVGSSEFSLPEIAQRTKSSPFVHLGGGLRLRFRLRVAGIRVRLRVRLRGRVRLRVAQAQPVRVPVG